MFDLYTVILGEKQLSVLGSKLAEKSWSVSDNEMDFSCLFETFSGP